MTPPRFRLPLLVFVLALAGLSSAPSQEVVFPLAVGVVTAPDGKREFYALVSTSYPNHAASPLEESRDGAAWQRAATAAAPGIVPAGQPWVAYKLTAYSGTENEFFVRLAASAADLSRSLANLSARSFVGTGDRVLIGGFVVGGTGSLEVLVRAVGPGLFAFGVNPVLADPVLRIVNASNQTVAENNDWSATPDAGAGVAAAAQRVGAFPLTVGSRDAAVVATLPAGAYTALVSAGPGATGPALVEVYDAGNGAAGAPRLINLSARAEVGVGADVLIPGLVVEGTSRRTFLIRALGPALTTFGLTGVLANPTATVFRGSTAVATNDNWSTGDAARVAEVAAQVGAFALTPGSLDAALVVELDPGPHTIVVSGVNNTTGISLVEVYEVR